MTEPTEHTIWEVPKCQSEVCLNGNWKIVFRLTQPMPNWFHRTFQRLVFGLHWRKYND
jgi:hypothetical protein